MVTVRPAQPTTTDARAFAELADMAASHLFSAIIGTRGRTMLEAMFLLDRNDYHYRQVRFVEVDGEIAGMVSGFSEKDSSANAYNTGLLHLRFISWHLPAVMVRSWPLRGLVSLVLEQLDGHFYIPFLAIHPEFRGRGLCRLLLEAAEEMARRDECGILSLAVDPANQIAMHAYHRFGLIDTEYSATGRFRGRIETLMRMEKPLT